MNNHLCGKGSDPYAHLYCVECYIEKLKGRKTKNSKSFDGKFREIATFSDGLATEREKGVLVSQEVERESTLKEECDHVLGFFVSSTGVQDDRQVDIEEIRTSSKNHGCNIILDHCSKCGEKLNTSEMNAEVSGLQKDSNSIPLSDTGCSGNCVSACNFHYRWMKEMERVNSLEKRVTLLEERLVAMAKAILQSQECMGKLADVLKDDVKSMSKVVDILTKR